MTASYDARRNPRKVLVDGREDVGIVVDEGKNIGSVVNLYCVGVHFPATGEVIYYEKSRVRNVEHNPPV